MEDEETVQKDIQILQATIVTEKKSLAEDQEEIPEEEIHLEKEEVDKIKQAKACFIFIQLSRPHTLHLSFQYGV